MRIRTRLTLVTGMVTSGVCLIVLILVLVVVHDREVNLRTGETSNAVLQAVRLVVRNELPPVLQNTDDIQVQVISPRGTVATATEGLVGFPRVASFTPDVASLYTIKRLCPPPGVRGCRLLVGYSVNRFDGEWIVYGMSMPVPWYVGARFINELMLGALTVVLLTMLVVWLNLRGALRPVADITARMAEITAMDLALRVPTPGGRDEINDLAHTVNATLDRLDHAVHRLRHFTSDASHDLRNPIAAMRVEIEEAALHPEDTDLAAFTDALLSRLDRFEAIVTDLLELARLDAGDYLPEQNIDLSALVAAEINRAVRHKHVVARLTESVMVTGDGMKLGRLLDNLLTNADRHAESTIEVTVEIDDGLAVVAVTDDGEGIARADRERVFERFVRLPASRQRDAGGTGLGLPIAREVAQMHGGSLVIEESSRGARFVLRLPLSHEPAP